jgi:hypothetical protein
VEGRATGPGAKAALLASRRIGRALKSATATPAHPRSASRRESEDPRPVSSARSSATGCSGSTREARELMRGRSTREARPRMWWGVDPRSTGTDAWAVGPRSSAMPSEVGTAVLRNVAHETGTARAKLFSSSSGVLTLSDFVCDHLKAYELRTAERRGDCDVRGVTAFGHHDAADARRIVTRIE